LISHLQLSGDEFRDVVIECFEVDVRGDDSRFQREKHFGYGHQSRHRFRVARVRFDGADEQRTFAAVETENVRNGVQLLFVSHLKTTRRNSIELVKKNRFD